MAGPGPDDAPEPGDDVQFENVERMTRPDVALILQLGEQRRIATDDRMWQVPAMSLTAVAFLVSAILVADAGWLGRLIAGLLGAAVLSAALVQLLKHRFHEKRLSEWLAEIERRHRLPLLHHPKRTFAYGVDKEKWYIRRSAPGIWKRILQALLVLDVGFCIAAAVVLIFCGWSA